MEKKILKNRFFNWRKVNALMHLLYSHISLYSLTYSSSLEVNSMICLTRKTSIQITGIEKPNLHIKIYLIILIIIYIFLFLPIAVFFFFFLIIDRSQLIYCYRINLINFSQSWIRHFNREKKKMSGIDNFYFFIYSFFFFLGWKSLIGLISWLHRIKFILFFF